MNLASPRVTADEAPMTLPSPARDPLLTLARAFLGLTSAATADLQPVSHNQRAQLALALVCDLESSDPAEHPRIYARHAEIRTQGEATRYIKEVAERVEARRLPVTSATEN